MSWRLPAFALAVLALAGLPAAAQTNTETQLAEKLQLPVEIIRKFANERGLTPSELEALTPERARALSFRFQYPGRLRKRFEAWRKGQLGTGGKVPTVAIDAAVDDAYDMRAAGPAEDRKVAGIPTGRTVEIIDLGGMRAAGISSDRWQPLGPFDVGGRTRSLVIDPRNPDRIWAGSAGGGVWYSSDAGQSWAPVDDRMASLSIASLAMDPSNPDIIYAGTGDGFYGLSSLRGGGIFRTLDGGQSWEQIPSTVTAAFLNVNRVAVSADGKVVLAATQTGLYRSATPQRDSWDTILEGDVATVVFHPTDPQRAILSGRFGGAVLLSSDGGVTWTPAQSNLIEGITNEFEGRIELAYARKNPQIVYASSDVAGGRIWRSIDGGRTFERRAGAIETQRDAERSDPEYCWTKACFLGTQGWYANVIWAGDPSNENRIVVGGLDLWLSEDGGNSFSKISKWYNDGSVHADQHAIVADPRYDGTSNRTLYFGNDGGVYRADDILAAGTDPQSVQGWTVLNDGYAVTQFYGIDIGPTGRIVGGTQDNGTWVLDGSTWRKMYGGDGGWSGADKDNPNIFYGEYVHLAIHRSNDGGRKSQMITGYYEYFNRQEKQWFGAWKPEPYTLEDARTQRANFIAPFVLDPHDPKRLLAGGFSLWRTRDARARLTDDSGPKWYAIKPENCIGDGDAAQCFPINAITVSPRDPDKVWVCHDNGDLFASANATAAKPSWRKLNGTPGAQLPLRACLAIAIDPADDRIAYVSFGGFEGANLWKTTDGGTTFTDITGSLPAAPIRSLSIHPARSSYVYAGTEIGLFASEDGGETWAPTNDGPVNTSVTSMVWKDNILYAATHGRGIFAIEVQTTDQPVAGGN